MDRERSFGVTETGLSLAGVIGLLLIAGYLVLHSLGGTGQTTLIEVRKSEMESLVSEPFTTEENEVQPHVLRIESSDSSGHAVRPSLESSDLH